MFLQIKRSQRLKASPRFTTAKRQSRRLFHLFWGRTPAQRFLRYYLLIIAIGTLFLWLPISLTQESLDHDRARIFVDSYGNNAIVGEKLDFWDYLFVTGSAFSDTGLSTVTIKSTFSVFGQVVIAVLIQMGGLGYMTLKIFLWRLIGRKIGFREKILLSAERGRSKIGGTVGLIKIAALTIIGIEIVGAIAMFFDFYFFDHGLGLVGNIGDSAWSAVFTSLASVNNAGFDIFGGSSLFPFYNDYFLQLIVVVMFIIGGIGFPVIYDIYHAIKAKITHDVPHHFSIFSKVSLITYAILTVIAFGVVIGGEIASPVNNSFWDADTTEIAPSCDSIACIQGNSSANWNLQVHFNKTEKVFALVFNTLSTRNAGFSTIPMVALNETSRFFFTLLMFIGSAPSSTAGGIRTTTFAVCLTALFQRMQGRHETTMFRRTIPRQTVRQALLTIFISVCLLTFATLVVDFTAYIVNQANSQDPNLNSTQFNLLDSLFEVTSAFGTTGLTTGLTPYLYWPSILLMIIIMFIGQLGVSATVLSFAKKNNRANSRTFPVEDLLVG